MTPDFDNSNNSKNIRLLQSPTQNNIDAYIMMYDNANPNYWK
jgi:hypothetical protein